MTLRLIVPPVAFAVSLVEAKAHLRIDSDDESIMVTAMIGAATDAAEHATGRVLMPQTWEVGSDTFPIPQYRLIQGYQDKPVDNSIRLTKLPVQSVTSITYIDTAGVMQTLSPSLYSLVQDDFGAVRIYPAFGTVWPAIRGDIDGVKIRYVAGYVSAASVPEGIKSWIKLHVGTTYANRESEVIERGMSISLSFADVLLHRYKVYAI